MSDFTDMLFGAGQSALGGGLGGVLGLGLQGWANNMQLDQQQKLNDMNFNQAVKLGQFNLGQQEQLWKDTNYSAQVDQLNKAGLNPALLYSKGGMGGSTATNPGQPGGSQAQPQNLIGAMGMQLAQTQLLEAQKRNIDADTANKEADTANKPLVGQNIQASTASLTQGVENQKAVEALTKIQTQIADFQSQITGKTMAASVAMAEEQANIALQQLNMMRNDAFISDNTVGEKMGLIKQQYVQAIAQTQLTNAQTGQTEEQTKNIANQIAQAWGQLHNEQDRTKIQEAQMKFNTSFGNQAGQILGSLLHLLPK